MVGMVAAEAVRDGDRSTIGPRLVLLGMIAEMESRGADVACIQSAYDRRMQQLDEAYKNISRPL